MKNLFAPWRSSYAKDVTETKKVSTSAEDCVFCQQFKESLDNPESAAKSFILKRFEHTFVMLAKYPYNAGHLLILPIKHVPDLSDLSKDTLSELMQVTAKSSEILSKCLKNDGLNVGINIGKVSGAGIPSHLHVHALPRWEGDTNFMPLLAETKVISFDLGQMYEKLKLEFENISL